MKELDRRIIGEKDRIRRSITFSELPERIKGLCNEWYKEMTSNMPVTLEEAIRDYLGCEDAREVIRQDERLRSMRVCIRANTNREPFLDFKMRKTGRRSNINWKLKDLDSYKISIRKILEEYGFFDSAFTFRMMMMDIWSDILKENGINEREAYYLPGARSGILQGWQLFASIFVEVARRRVGVHRLELPPFSGVAGDFLQVLWERLLGRPYRESKGRGGKALDILEEGIFEGKVILERRMKEGPVLMYESKGLRIPLQRASSMVAELAPLDLWIKNIVGTGAMVVIDEPEAHLHPSNQRAVARVLTRWMNSGVKVLITTHSPLIIQQLSNLIIASSLDEKTIRSEGLTKDDLIKMEDINVYLFRMKEEGTVIEQVEIEEGFGISEEEFVKVYDEIGEETYRLSREHPKNR